MAKFRIKKPEDGSQCPHVGLDVNQHKAMKGYARSQHITLRQAQWQANQFFLLFQLKFGTLSKNKPLSRRDWTNVVDETFTGKKF